MTHAKFYMLACEEHPCGDNFLMNDTDPMIFNSPAEAKEFMNSEPHIIAGGYTYLVECRVVAEAETRYDFMEWYHD